MDIVAVLLAIAAVLLTAVYVTQFFARRAKAHSVLNKIPGPTAYPIIGTTYVYMTTPRDGLLKVFETLIKKYGPIFCLWLGPKAEVVVNNPKDFEVVLNSTKHLEKSTAYRFLHPWLGTGLLTSSGEKWHSHRKMITPAFHLGILDSFIEVFSDKSEILMDILEKNVGGSAFDIFPFLTRCTLDVICETAMGVSLHAQEHADSEYVRAVLDIAELTVYRRERVWLHPEFIFFNTPTGRKYKECLNKIHGFTKGVIQERKAALSNKMNFSTESSDEDRSFGIRRKKAFLDLLLEISGKEGRLTDEELREEVDTFMFAGHDTTASSTSWTLYMLGLYPEIQEKVYAELSEIFQGSQRSPTMKDLQQMKYMERVIKETLRVYSTIPFIQRVLSEDVQIGGYDIPAGTTISILLYFINRNPEYFPNPEEFNPDNFLPERVQKRHHFAFIPFSAGPRNCIGQKFALLEEKTILSYILRKYKIRSVQKREDIHPVPLIVLRPESGINVTLTART